eukprot:69516_1
MTSDYMHYDISYDAVNCNVTINERLTNQTNAISKLSIQCLHSYYIFPETLQPVMHAQQTQFVHHLSASKLIMNPTFRLYFPGQLLRFEYRITDRTGNDVDFIPTDGITVDLELESGSFRTQLYIDKLGKCLLCDKGALIYSVSIQDSLRERLLMQLSVESNILVLDSEELSVNITGCPIGYGSDENNFTCSVCDADYFNLFDGSVNSCSSCDSDKNPGVSCANGIISILPNYWMGFIDHAQEFIISAKCPAKYCCSSSDGCDYIDDNDKLCATNRDYTSIMCGKCKPGFSESMTSVSCVQCKHGIYIAYILYPMMFALLWTAYITLSSSDKVKSDKKKQTEHKRCAQVRDLLSNDHFMTLFKT